ncbi:SMI1/KNR4 family protein [Nostoc sp. DSM 114167]|uniref:SMI1/KNR4 family protein n=1 Tax=Nostoc sp. DSM 114167 TaxID=3439050 RepID=UPI0040451B8E
MSNNTTELSTLNEITLKNFESQAGFALPQEYKNFCQVFGSGEFGFNQFFIEVPNCEDIEGGLTSNEIILESCKDSFSWSLKVQELLDNAYLFGGGNNFLSFIFDLRTYSEQDERYDIYALQFYSGFISYLGRDFFKFICDFCIGEQAKEVPGLLVQVPPMLDKDDPLYEPRSRSKTFISYNRFEEDIR